MLSAMRDKAAGLLVKLLLGLLIISFAAWGITDYLTPNVDPVVATVGDVEITEHQVRERYIRLSNQVRQQFGGNLSPELARELGLARQATNSIIGELTMARYGETLGLSVSDAMIAGAIASDPQLRNPDGTVNRERFQHLLFSTALSEAAFVQQMRQDFIRNQIDVAVSTGIVAPDLQTRVLSTYRDETRAAEIVVLPFDRFDINAEPSETELRTYYEENRDAYMAPEYRKVHAIILEPESIADQITVSDERIAEVYADSLDRYTTPATRSISQILTADEAAAQALRERLINGEPLEAVSEAAQSDGAQFADLGTVNQSALFPAEVASAAFAIPEPGVADIVQSPLGWHVLVVSAIQPEEIQPLEEVKDEIRSEIAVDLAFDEVVELANAIEDDVSAGARMSEAASNANVTMTAIEAVDRQGRKPDGEAVEGIAATPEFLRVLFTTVPDSSSFMTEGEAGSFFILETVSVQPPAARPFEDVRERVTADWRAQKTIDTANARADELAEQARGGTSMSAIASEGGFEAKNPEPFRRTASDPGNGLSRPLVQAVFDAKTDDVVVAPAPQAILIAKVGEISKPSPSDTAEEESIAPTLRTEIATALTDALRRRFEASINETALDRIN